MNKFRYKYNTYKSQLNFKNVILYNVCTENNARIVTVEKGLQDVVNTMKNHKMSAEVIEAASAALLSLSMEGERSLP